MSRSAALTLLLFSLRAAAADSALVVPYQSVGVKDEVVAEAARALQQAATGHGLLVLAPDAFRIAAAMCGEDANCLATPGQRAKAQWVVGYGLGAVGSNILFTALLVDAEAGAQRAIVTRKF